MSRLWTRHICIESPLKHLPVVSTRTSSVMTPYFILLPLVSHFQHWWRSYATCYVITYESLLLCKLCCPCHFCVMLLFKGCYHLSQFLCWPSLWAQPILNSVSMIFVLCLISSFWFGAHVGWCGMHQCPPSNSLPHWLQLIIWDRD